MLHVTIVILEYKHQKETEECLNSLVHIKRDNISVSVVVVNNDPEKKYQEDLYNNLLPEDVKITVINNEKNLGFTGGNNVGIKFSLDTGSTYTLILNNDTTVHPDFLEELLKVLESKPEVGIVSPKIYFAKGSEYHKTRYKKNQLGKVIWYAGGLIDWNNIMGLHRGVDEVDSGQFDTAGSIDYATGCCMLVKNEVIKEVGMFDDRYFLYYEDSDLSTRVKIKGYDVFFAPDSVIWHKNAVSTGGSGSHLQDYFITRNRLIFGMHYASFSVRGALVKESLRFLFRGRQWQKKGVIDFYMGRFGKGRFRV